MTSMDGKQSENLGVATVDAVALDNIKDVSTTLLDSVLTPLLEDTILENLPWFGIGFKLLKTQIAIRDRIFLSKVGRFLFQLKDVSLMERQSFVEEMNADPIYKQRVGENILLLLDRADDMEKADVFGNLFKFYIGGLITYDMYRRFAGIVDKAYLPDLQKLKHVANIEYIEEPELSRAEQFALYALGLAGMPIIRAEKIGVSTGLTELGVDFRKILLLSVI
jgi:hypothetical protein